ncbi:MAG: O-methyltransferase [Fimbriimonas sp.]
MLMNFGQRLASYVPTMPEETVHPHVEQERGDRFTSIVTGSVEIETLTFLNSLVYMTKPEMVLETGTGAGFGTIALAAALRANGRGRVHTVEVDPAVSAEAGRNVAGIDPDLDAWITFHVTDSLALIDAWQGPPFDFVFFDSLIAFRHTEFERLLLRNLLAPQAMCVFHDTSRLRGETMSDFNPEMIAALDRHAEGRQRLEFPLSRGLRLIRLD